VTSFHIKSPVLVLRKLNIYGSHKNKTSHRNGKWIENANKTMKKTNTKNKRKKRVPLRSLGYCRFRELFFKIYRKKARERVEKLTE